MNRSTPDATRRLLHDAIEVLDDYQNLRDEALKIVKRADELRREYGTPNQDRLQSLWYAIDDLRKAAER